MRFPDRLSATLWSCHAMVWMASWLASAAERPTWRSTQQRRFWNWCQFLAESGQFDPQNRLVIARSCWQLFPEAFWTRFDRDRFYSGSRLLIGSPATLLVTLMLAIAALVLGCRVVAVARIFVSSSVAHPDKVVVVTLDGRGINGNFARTRSETLLDLASVWSESNLASGLTPFSWGPGTILLPNRDLAVATARVRVGFFSSIGTNPMMGRSFLSRDMQECPECVLLSYGIWEREFHSDPYIVGKQIVLNGSPRKVIGVLPEGFRIISPAIAVWELIDPLIPFTNFQRRVGAVAVLSKGATAAQLQRDLSDLTESAGYVHPSSQIQVSTITAITRRNITGLAGFFALATACAILVTVLRRSARGLGPFPNGFSARVLWLGYFVVKSAFLLVVAMLAAWSAVHWLTAWTVGLASPVVDDYAIWLYLPLAVLALAWSIRDQQRRCRCCLRRLGLPVDIGHAGSVLLNWSGTEMVCPRGHGVLYLPDSPENSLDLERWSKLDDSWESLFRES